MNDVLPLILALALVVLIGLLLFQALRTTGKKATATFSVAELFKASITIEQDPSIAKNAVREAAEQRGQLDAQQLPAAFASGQSHAARILWVDDNVDNNVFETIALESIGRFVTMAASTDAAMTYLARLDFDLVISDVGRSGNPNAASDLIRRMRATGHGQPVVIYTINASAVRDSLLREGAAEVVNLPNHLLVEVERRLAG